MLVACEHSTAAVVLVAKRRCKDVCLLDPARQWFAPARQLFDRSRHAYSRL